MFKAPYRVLRGRANTIIRVRLGMAPLLGKSASRHPSLPSLLGIGPPPTSERWLPPAFASSARFGCPSDLANPLCHLIDCFRHVLATHRMSTESGAKRAVGLPAVVLVICMKNESISRLGRGCCTTGWSSRFSCETSCKVVRAQLWRTSCGYVASLEAKLEMLFVSFSITVDSLRPFPKPSTIGLEQWKWTEQCSN
jgi:hypothetical protein